MCSWYGLQIVKHNRLKRGRGKQTEAITPPYLSGLLELFIPSHTLRSFADNRIFRIVNRRKKFQGLRAFSFTGPAILNSLPFSVRHAQTSVVSIPIL